MNRYAFAFIHESERACQHSRCICERMCTRETAKQHPISMVGAEMIGAGFAMAGRLSTHTHVGRSLSVAFAPRTCTYHTDLDILWCAPGHSILYTEAYASVFSSDPRNLYA